MRDCTNIIPSARTRIPAITATVRRRKSMRSSRKSTAMVSAPKMTPGRRHANAWDPAGTAADAPSAENVRICWRSLAGCCWSESSTQAVASNGSRASAKTAFPFGSTT